MTHFQRIVGSSTTIYDELQYISYAFFYVALWIAGSVCQSLVQTKISQQLLDRYFVQMFMVLGR